MTTHKVPDGLPVLSRGKHRTPRKGACFMEMASVLADEPWSDKPACTHPLLAELARLVNDHTSDDNRGRLVPLIPSVIGVRGTGLGWEVSLTAAVAVEAIPDVPEPLQRALAAGLLRCGELAESLGPEVVTDLEDIRRALGRIPTAVGWASQFLDGAPLSAKQFRKRSAPSVMRCSVRGIVMGPADDPDARLRDLLCTGIETARRLEPQPALGDLGGRPLPDLDDHHAAEDQQTADQLHGPR